MNEISLPTCPCNNCWNRTMHCAIHCDSITQNLHIASETPVYCLKILSHNRIRLLLVDRLLKLVRYQNNSQCLFSNKCKGRSILLFDNQNRGAHVTHCNVNMIWWQIQDSDKVTVAVMSHNKLLRTRIFVWLQGNVSPITISYLAPDWMAAHPPANQKPDYKILVNQEIF